MIRKIEFLHISLRREEEELLSGAPDEFLCPIMSILMTDPVSKCLLSWPAEISMSFFSTFSDIITFTQSMNQQVRLPSSKQVVDRSTIARYD